MMLVYLTSVYMLKLFWETDLFKINTLFLNWFHLNTYCMFNNNNLYYTLRYIQFNVITKQFIKNGTKNTGEFCICSNSNQFD